MEEPTRKLDATAATASPIGSVMNDIPTDPIRDAAMMNRVEQKLFGESAEQVRVGRFVLGEVVGSGSMGVVHAAYDETLDRKVAIKLILEEITQSEEAQARLLREAQAMARVSHPNVVPVYEAGAYPGGVFVAMEFIEGSTLRKWSLNNAQLAWRPRLELLLHAGRGLAAAHLEGVVHRDFKPDNVMVTERGEPKVGDFGLAGELPSAHEEREELTTHPTGLTQTGNIVGTPVYMSPERFTGDPADARSDQFAFCVVAFEMLYGHRPFAGETRAELTANLFEGNIRPPTDGSGVPRYVRSAILRGLEIDPANRWPSMDALLAGLALRKRNRGWFALGAGGIAVGAGLWASGTQQTPCGGARAHLEDTWGDSRKAEIHEAFEQLETDFARGVWARSAPRIDAYADAWADAHTRNCQQTRVYAEQSEAVMDRRMACLQRARLGLAASIDLLATPDAEIARRAHRMVHNLPNLDRCESASIGLEEVDPPSPQQTAGVEQIEAALARARALNAAGKYKAAEQAVTQATEALDAIDYDPLESQVQQVAGEVALALQENKTAAAAFLAAQQSAMRNAQWDTAVAAGGQLAFATGVRQSNFDSARMAIDSVRGLADRSDSAQVRAALQGNLAGVLSNEGRFAESVEAYEASLGAWDGAGGTRSAGRPELRRSLAITLYQWGKLDRAETEIREVLRLQTAWVGAVHPDVALAYQTLANILYARGELDAGQDAIEKAVEIAEATIPGNPEIATIRTSAASFLYRSGDYAAADQAYRSILEEWESKIDPDHAALLSSRSNLAGSLMAQGRFDEARPLMQMVVASHKRAHGAAHPKTVVARGNYTALLVSSGKPAEAETEARELVEMLADGEYGPLVVGRVHNLLATALADQHRLPEALTEYRAGLNARMSGAGPDDLGVAETHNNIGTVLLELERYDEAEAEFREALRIWRKKLPADHPYAAQGLVNLARIQLRAGDLAEAGATLEEALKIVEGGETSPSNRGEVRFALAECLAEQGKASDRVAELANLALDDYAEVPEEISARWTENVTSFMNERSIARTPAAP